MKKAKVKTINGSQVSRSQQKGMKRQNPGFFRAMKILQ